MNDNRLTPEERAVIEAALELAQNYPNSIKTSPGRVAAKFGNAVDAYRKATAPPEPFERYMARSRSGHFEMTRTYNGEGDVDSSWDQVWRCTITPVERVR